MEYKEKIEIKKAKKTFKHAIYVTPNPKRRPKEMETKKLNKGRNNIKESINYKFIVKITIRIKRDLNSRCNFNTCQFSKLML